MKLKDHILTGTILGLILPVITLIIIHQMAFTELVKLQDFHRFAMDKDFFDNLVSLSGIPNLALFFLFLKTKLYENGKGIILATFVLVLVVIVLKFFI